MPPEDGHALATQGHAHEKDASNDVIGADGQRRYPHSLVNEAFDQMFDAIVRGGIVPSERLREAQLAKEMGISRGVLREAMQRLEARKLVQRTPNIGVQVILLSEEDLQDLYDVREALEGMPARLAALNMDEKDIKQLSRPVEKHARADDVKRGESYFRGASTHSSRRAIRTAG